MRVPATSPPLSSQNEPPEALRERCGCSFHNPAGVFWCSPFLPCSTVANYGTIDPQVSVEAEKLGVAEDDSLAHWKDPAATPNASLAVGDQSLELESIVEPIFVPKSLCDILSLKGKAVEWSNRLLRNSRIPMVDSRAAECRDNSRELTVIITEG